MVLKTCSGSRYVLRPEEIDPICGEDAASNPAMIRDIGKETAAVLAQFGIGGSFMEDCLQARREADAKHREKEEWETEPGELLLTAIGTHVIRSLFRGTGGTPVNVKPFVHVGMFQDSVLITDWESRTVDFRYFPSGRHIEPSTIFPTACGPSRCAIWANRPCTSARRSARWCARRGRSPPSRRRNTTLRGSFPPTR